jgi:RNA polymerase sigma-70 factor, ECF subfamily
MNEVCVASDGVAFLGKALPRRSGDELVESCLNAGKGGNQREKSAIAPNEIKTDEELLATPGIGSKDALAHLFRRLRPAVLSVAQRILRDASEAEDLCQEVFLVLFEKAKLFDPSKGSASSWIIQIAYHRAMNRRQYLAHRQHYSAQSLVEDEIMGSARTPLIDEIAARNLLDRLRAELSPEQMETLELHFFEGYSLREIAEKTGQTLGNVRHHYYRALDRLRSNVFPKKTK